MKWELLRVVIVFGTVIAVTTLVIRFFIDVW